MTFGQMLRLENIIAELAFCLGWFGLHGNISSFLLLNNHIWATHTGYNQLNRDLSQTIFEIICIKLCVCILSGECALPPGEYGATEELTDEEINKLKLDCKYANPATDRQVILSNMAKTAPARQQWIRTSLPTITEVLDEYPRLEDLPIDLVCVF